MEDTRSSFLETVQFTPIRAPIPGYIFFLCPERGESQRDFFSIKTQLSFCLMLSQERQETREQQGEFPVFSSLQEEGRADNLLVTKHTSSCRMTGRNRLRTSKEQLSATEEKNWKYYPGRNYQSPVALQLSLKPWLIKASHFLNSILSYLPRKACKVLQHRNSITHRIRGQLDF